MAVLRTLLVLAALHARMAELSPWRAPVQHEAERQAWTITPLAIHRHYSLQAKLPPAYAPSTPAVKWQTIMVGVPSRLPVPSYGTVTLWRLSLRAFCPSGALMHVVRALQDHTAPL